MVLICLSLTTSDIEHLSLISDHVPVPPKREEESFKQMALDIPVPRNEDEPDFTAKLTPNRTKTELR